MIVERFSIDERFRGPPRSGNGGYVCGRVASRLDGPVAVRLQAPPPLKTELRLESGGGEARLFADDKIIAHAKAASLDIQPPQPPTWEQTQAATQRFAGFVRHPFPSCFVCGIERQPGDGLRIFAGSVSGASILASPWIPDPTLADANGTVKPEFLWAALDCPGAYAVMPSRQDTAIVLGELCASIVGKAQSGERCIAIAWPLGVEGRKRFAGSAIYTAEGQLVAFARAVWIEVAASEWS
jgi:hypothetical protein